MAFADFGLSRADRMQHLIQLTYKFRTPYDHCSEVIPVVRRNKLTFRLFGHAFLLFIEFPWLAFLHENAVGSWLGFDSK